MNTKRGTSLAALLVMAVFFSAAICYGQGRGRGRGGGQGQQPAAQGEQTPNDQSNVGGPPQQAQGGRGHRGGGGQASQQRGGKGGPPSRPPGWDKGRKEGWNGSGTPPGLGSQGGNAGGQQSLGDVARRYREQKAQGRTATGFSTAGQVKSSSPGVGAVPAIGGNSASPSTGGESKSSKAEVAAPQNAGEKSADRGKAPTTPAAASGGKDKRPADAPKPTGGAPHGPPQK
jgi:hypothetical protein